MNIEKKKEVTFAKNNSCPKNFKYIWKFIESSPFLLKRYNEDSMNIIVIKNLNMHNENAENY